MYILAEHKVILNGSHGQLPQATVYKPCWEQLSKTYCNWTISSEKDWRYNGNIKIHWRALSAACGSAVEVRTSVSSSALDVKESWLKCDGDGSEGTDCFPGTVGDTSWMVKTQKHQKCFNWIVLRASNLCSCDYSFSTWDTQRLWKSISKLFNTWLHTHQLKLHQTASHPLPFRKQLQFGFPKHIYNLLSLDKYSTQTQDLPCSQNIRIWDATPHNRANVQHSQKIAFSFFFALFLLSAQAAEEEVNVTENTTNKNPQK